MSPNMAAFLINGAGIVVFSYLLGRLLGVWP